MARFGAPHGVRGLLRLQVFSRAPDFFLNLDSWWCRPAAGGEWRPLAVEGCDAHRGLYLVKLIGVDDRDVAAAWRNGFAAVDYALLPPVEDDTFYWCDLIGMRVQTLDGEPLGEVAEMMDIGAHDVLCVRAADGRQVLIPFVEKHVGDIDGARRVISVDWQLDW